MAEKKKERVQAKKFPITKEIMDYVLTGQRILRGKDEDGKEYKCVHSVWSGLSSALQQDFELEPGHVVFLLQEMERKQKIANLPTKGGVLVYLWEDRPKNDPTAKGKKVGSQIRAAMSK